MTAYIAQPLHAFTNATCSSIVCYARARVLVLRSGAPLDGYFCAECGEAKIAALQMAELIEACRESESEREAA